MTDSPPVLNAQEYAQLLEKLLAEGKGYGRIRNIVAFRKSARGYLITNDVPKGLGFLQSGTEPEQGEASFFLKISKIIDQIYEPKDPSHPDKGVMKPNPGGYHLVLQVPEAISIPVQWSDASEVRAGGYVRIPQREVEALSRALDDIRQGRATAAEALYREDPAFPGKRVAKFDVFGFDGPGIESPDFAPVELSEKTKTITARFGRAAAVPFTRRSANFVADHVAPERASFRKRTKSAALAV